LNFPYRKFAIQFSISDIKFPNGEQGEQIDIDVIILKILAYYNSKQSASVVMTLFNTARTAGIFSGIPLAE
jgi:hypothetical protein